MTFALLALALIAAGLALRLVPWGLPLVAHHYGGGLLWGGMVYVLVAMLRPPSWTRGASLAAAFGIVIAIEGSRLLHAPALDAFRLTLAGQLLLGRIFSAWNIGVDALGAAATCLATARWHEGALLPARGSAKEAHG